MAATGDTTDGASWEWACPYCRVPNPIDAATCRDCGAQLRDPDEDDLFTTVATENAQVVDLNAPRVKDSLWSTDVPPEEEVAEEVVPPSGRVEPAANTEAQAPQAPAGPFSSTGRETTARPAAHPGASGPQVFGASTGTRADGSNGSAASGSGAGSSPFSGSDRPSARNPFSAPPADPGTEHRSEAPAGGPPGADPFASAAPTAATAASVPPSEQRAHRITHDQHGLSVAVENLSPVDRERCEVPIAVCGGLLDEQEVVFGLVAGHLLGHSAVLVLTSQRVLVANARRWKPLVDQFDPGADLIVHLRHDRDIASITLVQGERLTGVDDISDVTMAVDLAERIKAVSAS